MEALDFGCILHKGKWYEAYMDQQDDFKMISQI